MPDSYCRAKAVRQHAGLTIREAEELAGKGTSAEWRTGGAM
jgi:hypothetical protein